MKSAYMRLADRGDVEDIRNMLLEDNENDYIPDILDEWVAEKATYVATDGEEILGMAHKQMAPDGSLWLGGLRVRKSARRRGIGRTISQFMANLPDSNVSRLLIDEENEASIGLTLKTGYRMRLTASIWVSGNSTDEIEMNELDGGSLKPGKEYHFGAPDTLVPTAWYGFELNGRAVLVANDFGLRFVEDRGRNVFLLNTEHKSATPMLLRKRELLGQIPEGYVVFGRADDDFGPHGYDQTLWAKRVVFFEHIKNAAVHLDSL